MTDDAPLNRETWPIAAALLQFPAIGPDGVPEQDAAPERWREVFGEIADVGYRTVELNDNWVRPGDLSTPRLAELKGAANDAGLDAPSVAIVRSSVIDPEVGDENLAYSHRTLDAAAELGCSIMSVGLHRALTPAQKRALWFWTEPGAVDPADDAENWALAVSRLQELGRHAADVGLDLTLEMYEDTYLGTGDSAVRLVTDIGLPNVGLNPDVGNLIRLHRPIEDWRALYAKVLPHANYWHIKNYSRDEDVARDQYLAVPAPLELGLVDYRWAVRHALSLGFHGIFVVEHYGGDGLGVGWTNERYLRTLLPRG